MRVADGDLSARTGVIRNDELGEAAQMFDMMVDRLNAIEDERSLMLSSISHDLRTPLAALRAAVEAIRDGVADDPDLYLVGMERQVRALSSLVDDLQLHLVFSLSRRAPTWPAGTHSGQLGRACQPVAARAFAPGAGARRLHKRPCRSMFGARTL